MGAEARISLPDWPRLMSVDQASAYLSLGSTTLREMGPTPKRHGKRVLYDRRDLDRWADSLGDQPLTEVEEAREASDEERRFLEKRARRGSH